MSKIVAVVLAAAGGFLAGVLLAPKSGKETREDIRNKTEEYKVKAQDGMEVIKRGASSIKDELKAGSDAVRNIAEDVTNEVKSGVKRASTEVDRRSRNVSDEVASTTNATKRATR